MPQAPFHVGQVLTGSLFNEPMRVETVSPNGASAWVLGLLQTLFTLYLCATNWSYASPLFTDVRGLIMLIAGSLWLGVGVFWMSRLVKVDV